MTDPKNPSAGISAAPLAKGTSAAPTSAGISAGPLAKKSKVKSMLKAFALAAACTIGATAAYQVGTIDHDVEFTVTDTETITYDCGTDNAGYDKVCHDYLITTEDADGNVEVFENTDALFHDKLHPDSIQNQLKVGCSFKASVYGLRMDWANEHRNIISAKEISCPETSADTPTNVDTSPQTLQIQEYQKPEAEKKGWEIKSTRPTGADTVSPEVEEKGWEIKSTRPAGAEASTDNTLQTLQNSPPPKKAFVIKSTR